MEPHPPASAFPYRHRCRLQPERTVRRDVDRKPRRRDSQDPRLGIARRSCGHAAVACRCFRLGTSEVLGPGYFAVVGRRRALASMEPGNTGIFPARSGRPDSTPLLSARDRRRRVSPAGRRGTPRALGAPLERSLRLVQRVGPVGLPAHLWACSRPGGCSFCPRTMNPSAFKFLISLLAILVPGSSAFADAFMIRDGERVVFLGDSITEQRLYTTYVEAYALTRHPQWKLSFRNVGWGGDTAWLRQRSHPDEKQLFGADESAQQAMVEDAVGKGLARDVLPLKPTLVTVKFGMNDHSYQAFREDIFRAYVRSQTQIAKVLKEHGARVAFLTPQPIEDKRADPDKDV